ncbi:MAG TPA: ABC transporter ATP-binding protein [Candidatus Dormibacteraeota bacterium]|nr:ABC transporter ATP-binding protein [Candidatus Dormibacteraeota bacterium]
MTASSEVAVDLREVRRHYRTPSGDVHAVDGVDLQVRAGRALAIMGPSGGGKSTLIALIGALEKPTSGTVTVLGTDLGALSDEQRATWRRGNVGFVFQAYDLLPFLTAHENVALQAALAGVGATARDDAEELLRRLGLDGHVDKLPDQLSGGQKQRVGIARSLIGRPRLVLADEPTGGLDSATSAAVVRALLDEVHRLGATAIVVTHDPRVAEQFDERIDLRDGRLAGPAAVPA